jgi:hypothetical protein
MIGGLANEKRRLELLGALIWADGVLAFVQADRKALVRARDDARTSGHPRADIIARSLTAFDRALAGGRLDAARELAALERHCAEDDWRTCGNTTTPNIAVHRMAAADWFLEAGDTMSAARLLTWHEARFSPWAWSFAVTPIAYLMQARIEEARGDTSSAQEHYEQFLRRYDMPMPRQRHLVEEAKAALTQLSGAEPTGTR